MWLSSVPSKVNIMVWRMMLKRLATKENLVKRSIPVDNSFCVFCGYGLECEDHFFMHCPLSALLLVEIKKWWNLITPCLNSLNDLLCWGSTEGLNGKRLLAFNTVLFYFCWIVWDYRNNRIFNKKIGVFCFSSQSFEESVFFLA